MLDTESPRAAWPKAPSTAGDKSSKLLTREDATCKGSTETEESEEQYWIPQPLDVLNPWVSASGFHTEGYGWGYWIPQPLDVLNPWISASGFPAEGCGGTIPTTGNCEVMKTQPDTPKNTQGDPEECDRRVPKSWGSPPPGFVQVRGFPGAHLQFLRCQGGGSSPSRHSPGPGAAPPEPLGHAQSLLPAQVPHCPGAQVANKSVWKAAWRKGEPAGQRVAPSDLSPFSRGCSFPGTFLLTPFSSDDAKAPAQRAGKPWKQC